MKPILLAIAILAIVLTIPAGVGASRACRALAMFGGLDVQISVAEHRLRLEVLRAVTSQLAEYAVWRITLRER